MTLMMGLGLVHWEGSDDFVISQFFMGAWGERTPYVLTVSLLLGKLCVKLQNHFPFVNWYSLLEILSIWFSFIIFEWFLIKHVSSKAIPLIPLLIISIEPIYFSTLQYTRVAFLLPFAGMLLIFDSSIGTLNPDKTTEKHRLPFSTILVNIAECISGGILVVLGSLFRYSCYYAAMAYSGILVATYFFVSIKKPTFKQCLLKILRFSLITLSVILVTVACNISNQKAYEEWGIITNYKTLNKTRADVIDYLPPEYTEALSSENINVSANDWFMMKCYVVGDDIFSYDYFTKVHANLEVLETPSSSSSSAYNFKQLLNYRTGRYSTYKTQFIISCVVIVAALLLTQRTGRFSAILDLLGTVVLLGYFLARKRLPPWVLDPICFFSLYISSLFIFQVKLINSRPAKYTHYPPIRATIAVIAIIACIFFNMFTTKRFISNSYYNEDIAQAISYAENSEGIFLLDNIPYSPYPFIDIYGPTYCFELGQWHNIIRVGGWDVGHPEKERQIAALGINSVLYSLAEGKSFLIGRIDSETHEMYKTFFREHYGIEVNFALTETFGEYGIFQCYVIKN